MIEGVCSQLRSLDEFSDLSPRNIQLVPLQTLAHSEVYRVLIDSPPASLILKKAGASDGSGLAERERRFYRHIAPLLPGWLVPGCRLVVDGDPAGMLFIEDLSESHHSGDNRQPTRLQCRQFVEALAVLHGLTSGDSTIRTKWTTTGSGLPAETIHQRLSFFQVALEPFIEAIRDRVDHEVASFLMGLRDLDEQINEMKPPVNVLVHGDAHFANALYSSDSRACLIDWAMPMIGFGEIDLAHALALNLPGHLRREWEEEMVSAYIDRLSAWGAPIERDAFYERYRLGVLYSFVSPVAWWWSGVPESQWWEALTNSLDASRDLDLIS